jgi:hypothetical protein
MNTSLTQSRRAFLSDSACGLGSAALASLLSSDARSAAKSESISTGAARQHAAKAKSCIFIYLVGGPSQLDLYDPKPLVNAMHGQKLPESITRDSRFAFIEKDTARIMGSPFKFQRRGECGMELSDLLPHLSTCADDITLVRSMHTDTFNHHPGELMLSTGEAEFGHPSLGAWLNYGLGKVDSNLPEYVALTCGATSIAGAANWSSGFLPAGCAGVPFRKTGEPVLNLHNPPGVSDTHQSLSGQAISRLNALHFDQINDPEILAHTRAYETAFQMQAAVPELVDLSGESQHTWDGYGLNRQGPSDMRGFEGGRRLTFGAFARNCLMARRLVERGVRFVNLFHASWDQHMQLNNNIALNCQVVDQPIAMLLKDLKQRGLLDSTLVVCASEFGRTPLGENKIGNTNTTGRDHHPQAFSIWLAGAGVKAGHTVGETDPFGWNVVDRPIHVHDLHATILHLFGLDHERLTFRHRGRDVRLSNVDGAVVKEILS